MARRRNDPYYHRGEPGLWSKFSKVLIVLLVIALVLGGAYAITLFQPKKVSWQQLPASGPVSPTVAALHDKSMELERQFHQTEQIRDITPADLEVLRQALRLETDYMAQANADQPTSDRIEELTRTLETYEAKPLNLQSTTLVNEASMREQAGDTEGARKLYLQAADLEDKILHDYPHSTFRDAAANLSQKWRHQARYLAAMPIHDQSVAAENTAETALAHQDWQTALTNFQRAEDLQVQIDHDFSDTYFASIGPARLQNFDEQITALRALPDYQKIQKFLADAKTAEVDKDYPKAAELYQQAERQQDQIVAQYPKSRFAADAKLPETLEILRQTALSRPLAAEIIQQATELFGDLRNRHTDQVASIADTLWHKADQFHTTFPRSTLIDDDLQQRLNFLYFMRNNLASIQEQVYGQLLPVPGQTRFLLEKEEVPQSLYALVAGSNPSRHADPNLPVESVNWDETHDLFCRRLSWILARPVRLPTLDEYNAALGSVKSLDMNSIAWNADNSQGQTHPVATKAANANGFYDLLGNVAEWLERPHGYDEDSAPAVGGSAQTPVDTIATAAPANLATATRSPYTGFRFVVDTDDSTPLLPAATLKAQSAPMPAAIPSSDNTKSGSISPSAN